MKLFSKELVRILKGLSKDIVKKKNRDLPETIMEIFYIKVCYQKFRKIRRKHPCRSLFLNKVVG